MEELLHALILQSYWIYRSGLSHKNLAGSTKFWLKTVVLLLNLAHGGDLQSVKSLGKKPIAGCGMRDFLFGKQSLFYNNTVPSNNSVAWDKTQHHYSTDEQLLVQTLEVKQRLFGDDYPATVTSRNNLVNFYKSLVQDADSYASQVQYSKAESLNVQSLELRKRLFGEDHPDVAQSLNNLACVYYSLARYSEAEPLLIQALEVRERRLGVNHRLTATTRKNLETLRAALDSDN